MATKIHSFKVATNDFGLLEESADGWDQRYSQMSPGVFTGSIDMTQVGSTQIFREKWGPKIHYRGTAPAETFGIALPFNQSGTSRWVGNNVGLNTAVIQSPSQEADMMAAEDWDALVFALPRDRVRANFAAMFGDGEMPFQNCQAVGLTPDAALRIKHTALSFFHSSSKASSDEFDEIELRAEQLVKLCLWEILKVENGGPEVTANESAFKIVSKATDLVAANRDRSVGLVEICQTLGVSLRSLHNAFQEIADTSPAKWLRLIRLNRVHRLLSSAAPVDVQVKKVALENGFEHLGHFGQQYRAHFGCRPVDTLRS